MVTWVRITNPETGRDITRVIPDDMVDRANNAAERNGWLFEITRRDDL